MTANVSQAIGTGLGLFITAKIAGAVIQEAKKIDGNEKDILMKQSEIKSLP